MPHCQNIHKHAQMGALNVFYSAVVSGLFLVERDLCGSAPLLLSRFPFNVLFSLSFSWIVLLLKSLSWALSPDLFLHVIFLSPSLRRFPQRWFLWPSLLPLFSPLSSSRSSSPPQTSVRVTGERTATFPRRSTPPLSPPIPFLLFLSLMLPLSYSLSSSTSPPPASSSISTLLCQPLCAFSLRLSPFTAPLFFSFFIYITPHPPPNLCQAAPPPLSPLICSSFQALSSPLLSSLWQHLPISLLWFPSFPSFILVPCSSADL